MSVVLKDLKNNCIQSNAPWVDCWVCTKRVKTCCDPNGGPCPEHDGVELTNKEWICSQLCFEEVAKDLRSLSESLSP